ncbi:MAG TPA: acyltransferase [Bradyrhizobium sp.]|nr:acyltransferase [Bradyrhizobium sp.]
MALRASGREATEFEKRLIAAVASELTPAAARKLAFLPRLESVRGIAAVAVVLYHVAPQFIETNVTGMAPVVMFFVLSGFVLARSLQNDFNPLRFFRHRVFRLLPAAAATVLLLTVLHHGFGFYVGYLTSFDPLNVLLNALMIRSDINGVMWSMTVECFATPLILWCDWMCRRGQIAPLRVLVVVLFALSFVGHYAHLLGGFTNLAPLYAFVIGVLLHHRGASLVARLTPRTGAILTLAAFALFLVCALRKQNPIVIMLECSGASALIMMIAFSDWIRPFRVLDAPIVRFYGRISYSFYLLHPIGIAVAFRLLDTNSLPAGAAIAATGVTAVAVTTAMAWPSWRLIEKPFVALGRGFDGRRADAAMPIAAQPEQALS